MRFGRADPSEAADRGGCRSCGGQPDRDDPVLVCPVCDVDSRIVASSIAWKVLHDGVQSRWCESCEQVTFVVYPSMACPSCEQLRPDINQRLQAGLEASGPGDPADAPCFGCGYSAGYSRPVSPYLRQVFGCMHCSAEMSVPLDAFEPGQGMHVACGRCGRNTEIPASIWCPLCGKRLRKEGVAGHLRDIAGSG